MKDIKFFCDDKGQHTVVRLREWGGHRDPAVDPFRGRSGRRRKGGRIEAQVHLQPLRPGDFRKASEGLELLCPTCGRNPQISEANLEKLRAAGIAEVDISRLPF